MLFSAFEPRSWLIKTDWSGSGVHRKAWAQRGLMDSRYILLHTAAAIATVYLDRITALVYYTYCVGWESTVEQLRVIARRHMHEMM
jgi:hypothetical protein